MTSAFFRFEAAHQGGDVAGLRVDPFPFYRDGAAAKEQKAVAVDTVTDVHPTEAVLLSRTVFLQTFSTLQVFAAYFTLALWNYMSVVRLHSADTVVFVGAPLLAEDGGKGRNLPAPPVVFSASSAVPLSAAHVQDAARLGLAYLALTLAGLMFTCLAVVVVAVVNVCGYRHTGAVPTHPAEQLVSASLFPRFLFSFHAMAAFDVIDEDERCKKDERGGRDGRNVGGRAEAAPETPAPLPRVNEARAAPVRQMWRGGDPQPTRRSLTVSIPLPRFQMRPHWQRLRARCAAWHQSQRRRQELRQQQRRARRARRAALVHTADGDAVRSLRASTRHQVEQQGLLYAICGLTAALTALDFYMAARTVRDARHEALAAPSLTVAGTLPERQRGTLVAHLTVLQFLTPVAGAGVTLYALRWLIVFAVMAVVRSARGMAAACTTSPNPS